MPNGRSGGFPLEKTELKRLLGVMSSDALLGHMVDVPSKRILPVTTIQIAQLVNECGSDLVAVEEQDGNSYIIHLNDKPVVWVMIGTTSPIFHELRHRHSQWMTEHPGWKGWIAF
jgi:hypothetical protein